jgi:uncharacterized protein YgiM (DUF1202 family)
MFELFSLSLLDGSLKQNRRDGNCPIGNWLIIAGLYFISVGTCHLTAQTPRVSAQERPVFPYQAIVANDGAIVRSGPGAGHYGTQELRQGDIVEVYRHDPNDWCAIRPLAESFSLVPAEAIEIAEEGIGVAKEDGVHVWVGTLLGPADNPLCQVKLKQGEEVTILGEISYPTEAGFSTDWLQIYPPSGEFRWIKRSDLLVPESAQSKKVASGTSEAVDGGASRIGSETESFDSSDASYPESRSVDQAVASLRDAWPSKGASAERKPRRKIQLVQGTIELDDPFDVEREAIMSGQPDNLGWRKARVPLSSTPDQTETESGDSWTRVASRGDQSNAMDAIMTQPVRRSSLDENFESAELAVVAPTIGNESMSDRLRRFDRQLSSEIIQPVELWNLRQFSDELIQIQATANSETERQHAAKLAGKLDRLRRTQDNLLAVQNGQRGGGSGPGTLTAEKVGTGIDSSVQFGTIYDAYGWLNELTQDSGRSAPTYVLQDDQGKIQCHIEPTPGLDLRKYLHTKIGVVGTRGYHQRLKLNHVDAERIVVLDANNKKIR